ncbi:MAG: hypothetical protein R3A48_28060 [Polyangiales bacterium]
MKAAAFAFCLLLAVTSCRRKHVPVDRAPELPYPTCDAGAEAQPRYARTLRAASNALEPDVVERFSFASRGCVEVFTARQDWHMNVSEIEVIYDPRGLPLRAWKRMTIPGARNGEGAADTRRYELRTPEVIIARREGQAPKRFEILRGPRPTAVIGPGRGLLSVWIQRANLRVGERVRENVLDMRELVERIRPVTLRREPDMTPAGFASPVRVYTVYGRETVFTDAQGVVLGDLGGMRPSELVAGPMPPALPVPSAPDPAGTP